MARKWAPMDAETRFCEDKVITADRAIQEDSADVILAIGPGHKTGTWVVNATAVDQGTGDEVVVLSLQGTNNVNFGTAGGNVELARIVLGKGSAMSPAGADMLTGRYEVPFSNERNGTSYKNVRMLADVTGTTPSVTIDAWISID